jgi:aspartyl-tRNA(Asn)/glutamyl-tRNA(Gln) amidotransferase subunit B
MPALANEIRERLERHGLSQKDIDVLMTVDSGNEVGFDGQLNHGAVTYFEALTNGRSSKVVVNWCVAKTLNKSDSELMLPIQFNAW